MIINKQETTLETLARKQGKKKNGLGYFWAIENKSCVRCGSRKKVFFGFSPACAVTVFAL